MNVKRYNIYVKLFRPDRLQVKWDFGTMRACASPAPLWWFGRSPRNDR